ncbi:MAG: hypothetical protein PF483_05835 [Halothiobacillus sp.]|jgi:hypothetical protein|nr:hypothetical protein [Halothiobacillus sp.]
MKIWQRLKGYRTHIVNAVFGLGAVGTTVFDSVFHIALDPNVQAAIHPVIPAKWAAAYAVIWAVANAAMRQVTTTPSKLFNNDN